MADITNQDLQNIAVRCTTDFFNGEIPLSESLAKQASEMSLNTEQIKRAVEATNTLTFLKAAQVAPDRTAEFPLADYQEVLNLAFLPKQASDAELEDSDSKTEMSTKDDQVTDTDIEKSASEYLSELDDITRVALLQKAAVMNRRALEDAVGRSEVLLSQLLVKSAALKKDERGLEKIAAAVDGDDFEKVARLVYGEKVERPGYASFTVSAKEREQATELASLIKEASDLVEEIKYRQSFAEATTLQKQAGMLGAVASGVGKFLGGAASAPFKVAGRAIGNGVKTVATVGANKAALSVKNLAAKSPLGPKLGITVGQPSAAAVAGAARMKKIGAGASVLAGAAGDALFYTPEVKPENDRSGDVWKALNG